MTDITTTPQFILLKRESLTTGGLDIIVSPPPATGPSPSFSIHMIIEVISSSERFSKMFIASPLYSE